MEHVRLATDEARVWLRKPREKVIIVGMGRTLQDYISHTMANGVPGDTEIWAVNGAAWTVKCDVAWNMHRLPELDRREGKNFIGKYQQIPHIPLVTIEHIPELPNSYEFPLSEAIASFQETYIANGVSYPIVYAIMGGVKELTLWGCDYNYPDRSSYEAGRANVEFWLGWAQARGMKISIPESSSLKDTMHRMPGQQGAIGYGRVYGYFSQQPKIEMQKNEDGQDRLRLTGFHA